MPPPDPAAPLVHLVCGSTGAGKTTFARRLHTERGAMHFAIDEWMGTLFWPDAPSPPGYEWAIARVERCERLIWSLACQELAFGREVVLDLGFSTRDQRDRFAALARTAGARPVLWFLDVPVAVRRARVHARNAALDGASIAVDDAMFDWMEGHFEPPHPDEAPRSAP